MARQVGGTVSISDSVTAAMTRAGPHPEGLSDHDRLFAVETRVYGVQLQLDQLQQERTDEKRKLDEQRDQLRAEIREATRAGWRLITVGLLTSAVGIVLGAFA